MEGCSKNPSERPEINDFEKRYEMLKVELKSLIEEDYEKFKNTFQ